MPKWGVFVHTSVCTWEKSYKDISSASHILVLRGKQIYIFPCLSSEKVGMNWIIFLRPYHYMVYQAKYVPFA